MSITVVIPVTGVNNNLTDLVNLLGPCVDQIVLSVDEVTEVDSDLLPYVCLVRGPRGRGEQISRGIQHADGTLIWVLHADTRHPEQALAYLLALSGNHICWGRFDVVLPGLTLIAALMNWRSRLTRICTGDQGMFFHAQALERIDGYPVQPLMEDIEVSARLKQQRDIAFLAPRVNLTTSALRWQQQGVARTVLRMWLFRLRYYFGATPEVLYRQYYR